MAPAASETRAHAEAGLSLIEMMVAITVLMVVSAMVMDGVFRMSRLSASVANRSDMHAGVRNATELLQQEIGQAGKISLPDPVRLTSGVVASSASPVSATLGIENYDTATNTTAATNDPTRMMFTGEYLIVGTGSAEETVAVTAVDTANNTFTATFSTTHAAGEPVSVQGGFSAGVVPPSPAFADGSTGSKLKILGDIHGNGSIVYVEYTCVQGSDTNPGTLTRISMPFDQATPKPQPGVQEILLDNILMNPADANGTVPDCFTYQTKTVDGTIYVTDVAVTLTVQTRAQDATTRSYQKETKALLNVSPRNVFQVWNQASLGITNRIQPMPPATASLLAD